MNLIALKKSTQIVLLLLVAFLSGCSAFVKTPTVANYSNLDKIDQSTTKNQVSILLGTPQGQGLYGQAGALKELDFYYGLAGEVSSGGLDYESGMAFVSYENDKLVELIYFYSKATGKPFSRIENLSIKDISSSLLIGKSKYDDLIKLIGAPYYTGRRANFPANINHSVGYWDASQIQNNRAIKEKWLLVGYDNERIIQDIIWVTNKPEDIKEFGSITEQQIQNISRLNTSGFIPVSEVTGMNTGTNIDPVQVDALIRSQPKNIKEIINVLGQPNALGMKNFVENGIVNLSNWSFSTIEVKGREENYIPPNATPELKTRLGSMRSSFIVMKLDQSRLIVSHTANGEIKEILWEKAIK